MSKIKVIIIAMALLAVLAFPVSSQQPPLSQCTPSMVTTVSPCMSFLTNSTSNGTSPSSDCCNSLRSLTTGGMGCLCLIVTGSVPFNIPINRTTAVSLPRAWPAGTFGPAMSPGPATTPIVPEPTPAAQTPQSDATQPFTPTVDTAGPTAGDGGSTSRPTLTPSSAYALSPSLLFFGISIVVLKFY
ncbi:hypothetical protein YC2023_066849 [Brassica napus]